MTHWTHWQAYLLDPLLDALLGRKPDSPVVLAHGRRFPAAEAAARQAAECAERMGFAPDPQWNERYWRCAALDRQDNFARLLHRSLTHENRLETVGAWPRPPFVALGLHWGTGFPALAHLQRSGLSPGFVYLPEDPDHLPSRPARIYDRLHLRALAGFGPAIRVGGAYQAIRDALAAERIPVVLIDAPPHPGSRLLHIDPRPGIDRSIRLRAGVLRLLAEHRVPFVFFRCWKPDEAARRRLEIKQSDCSGRPEYIAERAAEFLLETLHLDAAQWHFWCQAEALMGLPEPCSGASMTTMETR